MKRIKKKIVTFYKSESFHHKDNRRDLFGIARTQKIKVDFCQIKLITFTNESVKKKLVTGNHRHHKNSDQWEYIIVLGNSDDKDLIEFRFRNYEEPIQRKFLKAGDIISIPPGCSLGLVPLTDQVKIVEVSNKKYSENYEKINLFDEKVL